MPDTRGNGARRLRAWQAGALALATIAAPLTAVAPASGAARPASGLTASAEVLGVPRTVRLAPRTVVTRSTHPQLGQPAAKLPTFSKAFRWNGRRYTYRMVGTDPQRGAVTTTVTSRLVPVSLRVGGQVVAPSARTISTVTSSGLFTSRRFPGGTGQYGDVFMRTQFWKWLNKGTKKWHLVMARPTVKPYLVVDVPAEYGQVRSVNGVRVAFVDVDWLDEKLTSTVVAARPNVLTQVLAGNVVLCAPYTPRMDDCGIGGFHSAVTDQHGVHTYTYQAYLHGALYGPASGFTDIGPMSHELAEWMTDPFVTNVVPAWRSPIAPQYGCLNALESGDPVVGRFIRITGLTYQDEAYVSWFTRARSTSWLGRYTWFNSLRRPSPSCTL